MTVNEEWIKTNYNIFNREYWGDKLPGNLKFIVSMNKKSLGEAIYTCSKDQKITPVKIIISNFYPNTPEEIYKNALLHEMIHIYDFITNPEKYNDANRDKNNSHGKFFAYEMDRLNKLGWNVVIQMRRANLN